MGCSDVKVTAAHNYTENIMLGQSEWRANLEAGRLNEYCNPEIWHLMKLFRGVLWSLT